MKRAGILFTLNFLFLISCDYRVSTADKKTDFFFSLEKYFAAESERLNNLKPSGVKVLVYGSNADTTFLSGMDWHEELKLFADSDINKPAWRDAYRTDIFPSDSLTVTKYIASEERMEIRQIEIISDASGQIQSIEIHKSSGTDFYRSWQKLQYIPGQRYSIEGGQSVKYISKKSYRVEGVFQPAG